MVIDKISIESSQCNRDYSISGVRLISMCFIVVCHLMQRDCFASDVFGGHIEWAFWFNVGVQMFLFISGFLYGKKDRIAAIVFYKKSFPKLLIDYYIFIIPMLLLMIWSPLMSIDKYDIWSLLTLSGTVPGLEHLWFVPTILFCYLLVPVFSEIINAVDKHGNVVFIVESVLLMLIVHIVVSCFFSFFTPAWITCFVLGMIYSRIEVRDAVRTIFLILSIVVCLFIIPVQFRLDYWPHEKLPEVLASRYDSFVQYGHVFLGVVLVVLIRAIYIRINQKSHKHWLLNWSDKYSYDVYLVHHVFIQSTFGCVEFISNRWIAIPMAFVLTIITSMLLHAVSAFIKGIIYG